MVQACGKEAMEIHILDSGNKERQKDTEFTHGSMGIDIKVNLNNA